MSWRLGLEWIHRGVYRTAQGHVGQRDGARDILAVPSATVWAQVAEVPQQRSGNRTQLSRAHVHAPSPLRPYNHRGAARGTPPTGVYLTCAPNLPSHKPAHVPIPTPNLVSSLQPSLLRIPGHPII